MNADYEFKSLGTVYRQEGAEKRSKEIAKKMKFLNVFSDSFICEITGVNEKYLKRCKPIAEVS